MKAELILSKKGDDREAAGRAAIEFLEPLVFGSEAAVRPRVCRRLAELMQFDADYALQFEERRRLLLIVEVTGQRLTPQEEYQLAYLAYQVGAYEEGRRRFSVLRSTGRAQMVAGAEAPFILDAQSREPLNCHATVINLEGQRGWMKLEERETGRPLFQAPFFVRHFGDDVRLNRPFLAIVRISPNGPMAVPPEFARRRD